MRKQPKFEVGDIVEEFYSNSYMGAHVSIMHMVVKRNFIYFKYPKRNRWSKNFRYTFKELDSNEIWTASDRMIHHSNEFRKVA